MTTIFRPSYKSNIVLLIILEIWLFVISPCSAAGGEKMFFETIPFSSNVTHRQDMCEVYQKFRNGEVDLRNALQGMEIRPMMSVGDFFLYDAETGINPDSPGLTADLMDELALRAGFTWRQSFGIMRPPSELNVTWTEMLLWGVNTYDIAVNWWDHSVERMELGVAYIEPWFDGSLILIDKQEPVSDKRSITLFNWTRPFEPSVWFVTVMTIIASGFVYQLIEYLHGEREERTFWQWASDNLYLSFLNFTQNFEYAPNSLAGRIFGVSMGLWALIMTATYTANLASLFVDQSAVPLLVDSIEQAIALGIPICTYGNTNSDTIIKQRYQEAKRVPKVSELEAYKGLQRGECGLVASYKDNWLGYRGDQRYNPDCDLEWVGRTIQEINSGFAVKADAGHLCTSFIRDVFTLHMTEMIADGFLEEVWLTHRSRFQDIDCDASDPNAGASDTESRRLGFMNDDASRQQRKLKGSTNSAAAAVAGGGDPSSSSLSMKHMLGTFFLHWSLMGFAILVSFGTKYLETRRLKRANGEEEVHKRQAFRSHGPIVGRPPRMNTFVVRNGDNFDAGGSISSDEDNVRETAPVTYGRGTMQKGSSIRAFNVRSAAVSASPPVERRRTGGSFDTTGDIESRNFHGADEKDDTVDEYRTHAALNQSSFHHDAFLRKLQTDFRRSQREFLESQNEMRHSQSQLEATQRQLADQMQVVVGMLQKIQDDNNSRR